MSATDFADLSRHVGHDIHCVFYGPTVLDGQAAGDPVNVSVECETCHEVLLDFDADPDEYEGDKCPNCRSENIHGEIIEPVDAKFATRPVHCDDCGARWDEELRVCGYDNLQTEKGSDAEPADQAGS